MNIVKEIEKNIPLFRNSKYFYKFSQILKLKKKSQTKKQRHVLIAPLISLTQRETDQINYWFIIAQNIIDSTRNKDNNNSSSNLIEKYLSYKAKKVINALTIIEVKTKVKIDILLDLYIYLCKREIHSVDENIFLSKKEIRFFNNFISKKEKVEKEKEKEKEEGKLERMHIAESYINLSQLSQNCEDENLENDYKFKRLLYNAKKPKGCFLSKEKNNENVVRKVPLLKLTNLKLLPQIQTHNMLFFNRINQDSQLLKIGKIKHKLLSGISKIDNSFSSDRLVYKPINKKKIYSSGDVYLINKEAMKNRFCGKSVDYPSKKYIIN